MIKTSLKPLALLVAVATSSAHATPIISEYIEGSSNNKAIELFNPTDETISLSDFTLAYYSNGKTEASNTISLEGEIAAKGTYVIANSSASADVLNKADLDTGGSWYNGDDAIILRQGDTVIDSFGQFGVDPGSNWEGNGVVTKDKTLRRKLEITTGRTAFDATFDPSEQWEQFDKDDFSGLGMHGDSGDGDGDGDGTPPVEPLVCNDPSTTINAIQGSGAESPFKDQVVIIEAVVTADLQADDQLKGFFVQSLEKDVDADAMTSEGVFVYYTDLDVNVGDIVRLEGSVQEFYSATQIGNVTRAASCGTADVKSAQLTLPVAAIDDLEAFEGMLVSIDQQLYVNNTFGLGRYGEVALGTERLYQGTQVARPGSDANALEAQNKLKEILVDDGSTQQNLDPKYPQGGLSAYNSLRLGDTVNNITGVMGYSFNKYRIHPTMTPEFVKTNVRTEAPELKGEGDLRIASFNVLNYFNGDGQGGGFPTPRGADNEEELVRQQAKLVSAITALDADVIGLMEMENDGFGEFSAISDLVAAINAETDSEYTFVNFNTDKIGTDDITTAIIYRKDVVEEAGTASFTTTAPFDYSNRPPIAQSFRKLDNNEEFTVAVAHLKSKGGCRSADGNNADQGDGQGCWNEIRTEGANKFADWLMSFPTGNEDADIILVGDMNAYAMEDPIVALADKGLHNVVNHIEGDNFGYSYTFSGRLGSLDHAVASSSLLAKVTDATDWHINADEPIVFDYNTEFKSETQVANYYAEHAYRSSDHDPVIVEIKTVEAQPPVDPRPIVESGQIFQVRENSQIGLAIGKLAFTDADSDVSPVKRFIVSGTELVNINELGLITVAGNFDYEYENRIRFMVQAEDTAGNLSDTVEVQIEVQNVEDADDEDSGSLAWLSLLATPFAFLRRRRK